MNRSVGLRLGLFYAALFLGLGLMVPFFPVWLKARGLGVSEISLVLASQMAVRIIAGPAFSFLADSLADRRAMLRWLSAAAFAAVLLLGYSSGFESIFLLSVAVSVMWTPIIPLTETLAVAESEGGGADYGRTRLWGSLSFIAGSVGGGYLVNAAGPELIIWLLCGAYLLMAIGSFWLPEGRPSSGQRGTPPRFREVLPVLLHPVFLAFLAAASLIQASHALYYGFGTLHWQSIGIGDDVIGALWSVGVVAEVVLFVFARSSVAWAGPVGLVIAGGLAGLVRWTFTATDPGLGWLFAIQLGHALTFGATHLGTMHFIARAAPERFHATVQGVHAAFSGGIVMALAMAGSGKLYAAYGGAAYGAMAAMGLLGAVFAGIAALKWDGGKLDGD